MVMFFYNYNQRNFAMGTIVPDLSNPSEILRLIRELPVVSPRCKVDNTQLYPTVPDYRLEQQFPGARCIGMKCHNGECRISLVMSGAAICPDCGRPCSSYHGYGTRKLRDCPFAGVDFVEIQLRYRRVKCTCGCTKKEYIPWLLTQKQMTLQFQALIQHELRMEMPISKIAETHNVSWHTVKDEDKTQLAHYFSNVDVSRLRRFAIDEFALHKGHKYATTFMDLDTGAIFYVVEGKTVEAVKQGFDHLKDCGVLDQIEAVACDMNAGFPKLIKRYCPNADLVYDLFHVISNFKDVLREARLQVVRTLDAKAKREFGRHLRGIEWSILMPRARLTDKRREDLDTVLKQNELFAALQPLVPLIREIWRAPSVEEAEAQLTLACKLLKEIGKKYDFEKAKKFGRMLNRRRQGILQAWKHRIGTNRLEGANNKIKVLKRLAYGYRDFEYFALKIKSSIGGYFNVMLRCSLRRSEAVLPDGLIKDVHLSFSVGRLFSNRPMVSTQMRRKTYGPPRPRKKDKAKGTGTTSQGVSST